MNAGNLDEFIDPSSGLEVTTECRTKDTKEIVDCDDPTAYYKTKKISTSGFEGYAEAKRKGGFLNEAYLYQSGILKEITYGKGSFLKYFSGAGAPGWFAGSYDDNPDFDNLVLNMLDDPLNFWTLITNFTDGTAQGWVYIQPTPIYSGDYLIEGYWMYHDTLGWFLLNPEQFPWFYVTGSIDGNEIGWAFLDPGTPGRIWIENLLQWRKIGDINTDDTNGDSEPNNPLPTELPTLSERPGDDPPPR